MQHDKVKLPSDFYSEDLKTINNIRFTEREIDIFACIIKKDSMNEMDSLLGVGFRTVGTHIRSIMGKLQCNSQARIREVIKKLDKYPILNSHYLSLRLHQAFIQSLKEASKLTEDRNAVCQITYWADKKTTLIKGHCEQLEKYLKLSGIKAWSKGIENVKPLTSVTRPLVAHTTILFALSDSLIEEFQLDDATTFPSFHQNLGLYLLCDREPTTSLPQQIIENSYVELGKKENYYYSVFEILKKVLTGVDFDRIISGFKNQYKIIYDSPDELPIQIDSKISAPRQQESADRGFLEIFRKNKHWLLVGGILCFITVGILLLISNKKTISEPLQRDTFQKLGSIRSDLPLPSEDNLLQRSYLVTQIKEKLKEQQGIQTVAIVGIGGAGKTTLARQYAHSQNANVIWEVNAETKSINQAFENLAYALSKTEEERKLLKEIQRIKGLLEREEKIRLFVKGKLKAYSDWLLIYDNVETLTDIQKYFPSDPNVWGRGKAILTTRDSTIQNSINHIIHIGELSSQDKFNLFAKIINNKFTAIQEEETRKFLVHIPPFPLEVSSAAYYLKATNTPYKKYLGYLKKYNQEFTILQANLLKELSNYTKTRYSIITLSLKQMIETHKDFKNLLLFISLLDSQNIPNSLLDAFKSGAVVDNFIYHLKKYSFISSQSSLSPSSIPSFSIHRSTQAIILDYLTTTLNLEKSNQLIKSIGDVLCHHIDEIIEEENIPKIKNLISHIEMFLFYKNLLPDKVKEVIFGELGCLYFFLGNYIKAIPILEESFTNLNKNNNKFQIESAYVFAHLGNVYRELGDYEKAKQLLEQSFMIYKKHFPNNLEGKARVLIRLGAVYLNLGDYEKAKQLLEQSLMIYKEDISNNHGCIAQALTYLGYVYRATGNYEKAKSLYEESISIYKQHFSEDHIGFSWILGHLGVFYRELGEYKKAKNLFEQSLTIYKKHLSKDHTFVAWILTHLGIIYGELGNYKKAKQLLEQSLMIYHKPHYKNIAYIAWALGRLGYVHMKLGNYKKAKHLLERTLIIYKKNYGKDHTATARILQRLGQVYLLEGNTEAAENLISKSLKIFQQNKHPEIYICLESLAELYLKKSNIVMSTGDMGRAQVFKRQAIDCLKEALEIVKERVSPHSPHITRIHFKLEAIRAQHSGEHPRI
ncbi:tetratricopeptide repeat protein [Candidatus Paracaedibacter symbiosus]|uniref:tetratricopeptide repeat protein n=1 Tax=Candidatus Paracaedibacter symbiosus TaxID=244582 RepID=UPI000509984A|nr:tetratricopeptide repeat protein [Candidatus Paracaedibacter symbiosus]